LAPEYELDGNLLDRRTIERKRNVFWTVVDSPFSLFAESIRSIKMAADLSGSTKVIGLTSSLPDEGKSTIAIALAQLAAQAAARTILVDCDLRNPKLSQDLCPRAELGVLEVISGKVSLEEAIWKEKSTDLAFLPAVTGKYFLTNSNEILASAATKKLFERLREIYDYVIVDVPPLEPLVDVRATAHLVDSYVFVVQWGRTRHDVVERALRSARCVREKILGAVLNRTDMRVLRQFEGYRSDGFV